MTKTIMSVDDSASMRQMVSMTLQGAGYNVSSAVDGQDALDKLSRAPVDMVIADLNMPNMDGITLIRRLRAMTSFRFIPIILLTTESHEEKKREGKAAGATGWIVKPFAPEQLIAVVKRVLG